MSFLPFLSMSPLFDWDEVNFAEAAREMIVTGDYWHVTIGFVPFYEKPPLFFWLQALSMHVFGINEFAARLPNALAGAITLIILFNRASHFHGNSPKALLWPLCYLSSWLPSFYFRSGIIDPVFNLFIFLSVLNFYRFYNNQGRFFRKSAPVILSALYAGLAVLTKGPVGLGVPILVWAVFYIMDFKGLSFPLMHGLLFLSISLAVGASWFVAEYLANGPEFFRAWLDYQRRLFFESEAGHGQPWFYHPLVLLLGCFPASWFMAGSFSAQSGVSDAQKIFNRFMWILFWVVLIVFSIVKTKIVHYSSLCYFPITWFAASFLARYYNHRTIKSFFYKLAVAFGLVLGFVLLALPMILMDASSWSRYIRDPFARANLEVDVGWTFADCLPGVVLIGGMLAALYFSTKSSRKSILMFLFSNWFCMMLALPLFVPKIQAMTQGAMIDYFKSFRGRKVYVHALGFRSYAQFYYAEQQPELSARGKAMSESDFSSWLREEKTDYDVYLISKDPLIHQNILPEMEITDEKGGYTMLRKKAHP